MMMFLFVVHIDIYIYKDVIHAFVLNTAQCQCVFLSVTIKLLNESATRITPNMTASHHCIHTFGYPLDWYIAILYVRTTCCCARARGAATAAHFAVGSCANTTQQGTSTPQRIKITRHYARARSGSLHFLV